MCIQCIYLLTLSFFSQHIIFSQTQVAKHLPSYQLNAIWTAETLILFHVLNFVYHYYTIMLCVPYYTDLLILCWSKTSPTNSNKTSKIMLHFYNNYIHYIWSHWPLLNFLYFEMYTLPPKISETSAKIILPNEWRCRDATCEKWWKLELVYITQAHSSKVIADSCVTP